MGQWDSGDRFPLSQKFRVKMEPIRAQGRMMNGHERTSHFPSNLNCILQYMTRVHCFFSSRVRWLKLLSGYLINSTESV